MSAHGRLPYSAAMPQRRALPGLHARALVLALLTAGCGTRHEAPTGPRVVDGLIVATSDSTFVRDVIAPRRPTVVYYWAVGCIPCYGFAPHVRRLAARY